MTYSIFLILIIIVAALLMLIIMVQNPKGGGLSSSLGGGSQSLGGVQNTSDFLDKSTWTLAFVLIALILVSNFAIPRGNTMEDDSRIQNTIENREVPTPVETPAK